MLRSCCCAQLLLQALKLLFVLLQCQVLCCDGGSLLHMLLLETYQLSISLCQQLLQHLKLIMLHLLVLLLALLLLVRLLVLVLFLLLQQLVS